MIQMLITVVALAFDLCGSYKISLAWKDERLWTKNQADICFPITFHFGIWTGKLSSEDSIQYIAYMYIELLRNVWKFILEISYYEILKAQSMFPLIARSARWSYTWKFSLGICNISVNFIFFLLIFLFFYSLSAWWRTLQTTWTTTTTIRTTTTSTMSTSRTTISTWIRTSSTRPEQSYDIKGTVHRVVSLWKEIPFYLLEI